MGARTGIAWTDATWNPWRGCRKVSAGCAHCYMYREQERYGRDPKVVVRAAWDTFGAPLRWQKMVDDGPAHDYSHDHRFGAPRLVFTCSWSDFFIEEADAWREEAWDIIRRTPSLTYQILTKRPERVAAHLPSFWLDIASHVWLGVSIENQDQVRRWDELAGTFEKGKWDGCAARVLFVSAEPLLEQVRFDFDTPERTVPSIPEWVIAGGESGPAARAAKAEWFRVLRDECAFYEVPFFLKQLGGWPDQRSHEKAVLDGRTWTEMPA